MKRCLAVFLCILFCLPVGCTTQNAPAEPTHGAVRIERSAADIAEIVAAGQGGDTMTVLSGDVLTGYLNSLGLTGWKEAFTLTGQGMDAREITVIRLADEKTAERTAQCLEDHRKARIGDFFGYAPDQADLLERARVVTNGNLVAFLACADMNAALAAFAACFDDAVVEYVPLPSHSIPKPTPESTSEPTPEITPEPLVLNPDLDISTFPRYTQPGDVDMTLYDHSGIVAAWNSGDATGLTAEERAILEVCRTAFDEVVTEGMTDYRKELALHDWLMAHGKYDELSRDNVAHIGRPDNTNPYGMLVGGYGICLGFATTFQLLMDLAGIECITVIGAAYDSTADHAWNMVRLDGEWYCVDVTWNNSYEDVGQTGKVAHKYFNVTSTVLRENQHQWDYRNVPETTATRYRWSG